MITYHKALRPDGTSFHDPTFQWGTEPGDVTVHPHPDLLSTDAADWLSASTEAANCTGFQWPCRLFEVEPVGEVVPRSWSKVSAASWRIVRELPAHRALGPNGRVIVAFLDRLRTVTDEQLDALDAVWWDAWTAAAANVLAARDAARLAAWDATPWAAREAARDATRWVVRGVAAVGNVALALTVWDRISPDHRTTITALVRAALGDDVLGEIIA